LRRFARKKFRWIIIAESPKLISAVQLHRRDQHNTGIPCGGEGRNQTGTASFDLLNLLIPNPSQNANYRNYAANIGIFAGFLALVKTWN
jgi:hypothetical protein